MNQMDGYADSVLLKLVTFSLLVDSRLKHMPELECNNLSLLILSIPSHILMEAHCSDTMDSEAVMIAYENLDSCIKGIFKGIKDGTKEP